LLNFCYLHHTYIHNEDELLILLQNGNEEAFARLFNMHRGSIYTVACKFLRSAVLAEEIVQDVFLKIWLKRSEMAGIQDFKSYLFIMARNFIFDRIKKMAYETAAKIQLKNEPFCIDDTEHLVRQHQCQQLLQQAIELLPPQQKKIYLLAKDNGLSHEKIAGEMKLSKLTVKTHMAKALQSIRKYLTANLNLLSLLPLLINFPF
jgi:RNA polymerase sigma-70 factor (family 1)